MGESTTKFPDYWKHFPQRWLLSDKVRKMPLIAVAGYRFIVDHSYLEQLPGLLPLDDEKLSDWARMTTREWKKYKKVVQENFEIVVRRGDESGISYLLHPFVARLYREWTSDQHARACKGIAAASHRWGKKPDSATKMPLHADPYRDYAKEVSNKLTSVRPPPSSEDGGSVEGVDGGNVMRILAQDKKLRDAYALKNGIRTAE